MVCQDSRAVIDIKYFFLRLILVGSFHQLLLIVLLLLSLFLYCYHCFCIVIIVISLFTDELREVIDHLREELANSQEDIDGLQRRIIANHSLHFPDEDPEAAQTIAKLRDELEALQNEHFALKEKNIQVETQLEEVLYGGPESDTEARINSVLKQQLEKEREKNGVGVNPGSGDGAADNLKLQAHVQHCENVIELLKKQLELNTADKDTNFNPELIVQMAQEIERLKEECHELREKDRGMDNVAGAIGGTAAKTASGGLSSSTESLGRRGGGAGSRPLSANTRSRIPRLDRRNSSGSGRSGGDGGGATGLGSQRDLSGSQTQLALQNLRDELNEGKVRIKESVSYACYAFLTG